jgi:hypothetical protein
MHSRWTTNSAPGVSLSDGFDGAAKAPSAVRYADASKPPTADSLSSPQRNRAPLEYPATPLNASIVAVGSDLSAQSTDPFLETIDTLLGPLSPGEDGSDPFASVPRARRRAI